MFPPRRPFIPLLVALFLLAAVRPTSADGTASSPAPRDKDLAYLENLPESNPYRSVMLRYQSLPKEERAALRDWANGRAEEGAPPPTLNDSQTDLARELTAAIVAARNQPSTSHDDWPLLPNPEDPDNPAAISFPNVGNLRELAKIAVKNASSLPPGEAIDIYAAVAQLARQQRSGETLIEQLVGLAIEGVAQAEAATRLNEFSAEELLRLSSTWDQLMPRPSNADALAGEREVFFRPWVENVLVPGLKALLENPNAGLEQNGSATDPDFTRDLRLSGLMDLGEGRHRIVFENTRTGEFVPLDLGRPVDGLELVSLDYEKRVAVIRRNGHEALVHLESKRIVPRKSPAIALRKIFEALELFSDTESGKVTLEKLIEIARAHPGGAEGYGKDLFVAYQAHLDHRLKLAESAQAPQADDAPPLPDDPFLAMSMPAIGKVARTINSSATQTLMFQAAIRHRLLQLNPGAAPAPVPDPWSKDEAGFVFKPAENGVGFLMTSRYEINPGQPVAYKFAAPDAGFVRLPAGP